MHTTTIDDNHKLPVGKLVFGLILFAAGVLTFLEVVGLWDSGPLWSYWPLILIAIGLANEIDAIRNRKDDGSMILLGVGVWMLFGSRNLFGLSYGEAMPVGIIVVGLGILVHAIIDVPRKAEKKENEDERH